MFQHFITQRFVMHIINKHSSTTDNDIVMRLTKTGKNMFDHVLRRLRVNKNVSRLITAKYLNYKQYMYL